MTVKELIEKLQQMPENLPVQISYRNNPIQNDAADAIVVERYKPNEDDDKVVLIVG